MGSRKILSTIPPPLLHIVYLPISGAISSPRRNCSAGSSRLAAMAESMSRRLALCSTTTTDMERLDVSRDPTRVRFSFVLTSVVATTLGGLGFNADKWEKMGSRMNEPDTCIIGVRHRALAPRIGAELATIMHGLYELCYSFSFRLSSYLLLFFLRAWVGGRWKLDPYCSSVILLCTHL
ncbi:hypothetical protein F5Y09DRAFT_325635 [Xylaria sp. FL1042]|nr:hypothetical protein F5Y09DRAFT_325635 [Xylaria sp. FL1042]